MKQPNYEKLEKLAAFLEKLPSAKFNFADVVTKSSTKNGHMCGSICCAIGWTPKLFPKEVGWTKLSEDDIQLFLTNKTRSHLESKWDNYLEVASSLFDVDYDDAYYLFSATEPYLDDIPWIDHLPTGIDLSDEAKPKDVAGNIRAYIKYKYKLEEKKKQ